MDASELETNYSMNRNKYKNDIDGNKRFEDYGNALSNIKENSDEWKYISAVNVRPLNQRATAPIEKNLTDLFSQIT